MNNDAEPGPEAGRELISPKSLTEYEGTVPSMFRRGSTQLDVPRHVINTYSLSLQLGTVRDEAALKWRQSVATGQQRNELTEGDKMFAEGCGPDGRTMVGRHTSSPHDSTLTEGKDADSTCCLLEGNRKSSGVGRLARVFQRLGVASDVNNQLVKIEPWVERYRKQNDGLSCVKKKRIKRLANNFPLRKNEGYMSLTSLLSCTTTKSTGDGHTKEPEAEDDVLASGGPKMEGQTEQNSKSNLSKENDTGDNIPRKDCSFVDIFSGTCLRGYKFSRRLEEGASSVIFLVEKDEETFVAKVSNYPYSECDKRFKILRHEYKVMKRLEHPNIVKVFEYFVHCNHGVIIMEHMEAGELTTYLEKHWPLPGGELKRIMRDILKAVRHLQRNHFIHMDIKPDNILVDGQGHVKLADFGGATRVGRFRKNYKLNFYTLEYSPPEKHREEELRRRHLPRHMNYDIWSVGVVFYQLHTGDLPYLMDEGKRFLSRECFDRPLYFPEDAPDDILLQSLIRQCLAPEPADRIRPKDALSHPFFFVRES